MSRGIRVEVGRVVRITLARPEARNALTAEMQRGILLALEAAATSEEARVVVLQAEGEHFCAGVDLKGANATPSGASPKVGHIERGMAQGPHRVIRAIWDLQLPVIAAVRGHAAGMGCNMALACDYRVASRTARFSQPFTSRGFVPDTGAAFFLPRLVGLGRAKEMLLFGRTVDGDEAADWGLVNEVCEDDRLEEEANDLADQLSRAATVAIGFAKELVHRAIDLDLGRALGEEGFIQEIALRSRDFKEGMVSFMARRPPEYEGR